MKKQEMKISFLEKLLFPELRKLKRLFSEEEKREFYNTIAKKVKNIVPEIDESDVFDRLNDFGNIVLGNYENDIKQEKTGFIGTRAYYNASLNFIYTYETKVNRIIFHECMHKLQRRINKKMVQKDYPEGINEGAVELTTEMAYGDGTSSFISIGNYSVKSNLSEDTAYEIEAAMVSQINQILGHNSIVKSVVEGDIQWIKEFKQEYGNELFNKIVKIIDKLHHKSNTQNSEKTIRQIKECQNLLLSCYDKKLEKCITEQDFLEFLNDLQQFQTCQLGIEGDKSYEFYQKSIFDKIKEIFISRGYSMNQLKNYVYTEPKYKPTMSVEKQLKGNELDMFGIARDCVDTNQFHSLSEYTRKMDANHLGYDVLQRDGRLISCRIWREKNWSICQNPQVINDSTLRNRFNVTEGQNLYMINVDVFIVEDSNGNIRLYDVDKDSMVEADEFQKIDIGISESKFDRKIEGYIKSEKKDRELRDKQNKKILKKNKGLVMLPEGQEKATNKDEAKKFKDSIKQENFISQFSEVDQKNYELKKETYLPEKESNANKEEK